MGRGSGGGGAYVTLYILQLQRSTAAHLYQPYTSVIRSMDHIKSGRDTHHWVKMSIFNLWIFMDILSDYSHAHQQRIPAGYVTCICRLHTK